MKRMLTLAIALLALAAGAARAADKPQPVKVTEETITHKMEVSPLEEKRLYPLRPDSGKIGQAKKKMKARQKELTQSFTEAHADEAAAARQARKAWGEMSVEQRKTDKGKKLAATWQGWEAKLAAAIEGDVAYSEARKAFLRLRDANIRTIDAKAEMVTLNNGLIEVKVLPTLGMRVLNAVDLKTSLSFSGSGDPRAYEKAPWRDIIGWTAGYQELSFPYFEHGMGVRQSAGYRVIKREDGSVTVAMNMRFTDHQHPRHMSRYGRYSQRHASVWVTLRPGESCYTTTYRIDNPNPLPRSPRAWTNILMETEKYDGEHILFPAGFIMPHNGGFAKPFYASGGKPNWRGVSHFALYPEHEYCGVYSPKRDNNCLIIRPAETAPGMKLYTQRGEGGFLEIWTGSTTLFEYPGRLTPGYVPSEYKLTFYNVHGIGRVDFANEHIAAATDEVRVRLIAPREAKATVLDADGKTLGQGPVGPHTPLTVPKRKTMTVKLDGKLVAQMNWPKEYKDTRDRHAEVKALGGKFRIELEEISNHRGAPRIWHAIREAKKMLKAGKAPDTEYARSIARGCYRYGHFEKALKLAKLADPAGEQTDLLKGLIAWERGGTVDFASAGVDSYYHRALLALQQGNKDKAVEWAGKLIDKRPGVYRPRLALAYWQKDKALAGKLAQANPASPEAQLVLSLLGDKSAAKEMNKLLTGNPGAKEQVDAFKAAITKGTWRHIKRYKPLLPEDE